MIVAVVKNKTYFAVQYDIASKIVFNHPTNLQSRVVPS